MCESIAIRCIVASDAAPKDIAFFAEVTFVRLQQISLEKDSLATENEYLRQKVERLEFEQQTHAELQQAYEALVTWGRLAYGRLRIYAPRSETYRNAPYVVKRNFDSTKEKLA